MQPQPEAPSSVEPPVDATPPEQVSEQAQEVSQRIPWWHRIFGQRGEQGSPSENGQESESREQSSSIQLTQEELDKRIQAEADRREQKRIEAAKVEAAKAERRKLRDTDPFAYAEQDRQAEQQQVSEGQVTNLYSMLGSIYDQHTLDPLMLGLPESERARILKLEGAGTGLPGRKLIVEESLKSLEKHWKAQGEAEAEKKLRKNPAFRKQLLNEMRSNGYVEPEVVSSGNGSESDGSVSGLLRQQLESRQHRSL